MDIQNEISEWNKKEENGDDNNDDDDDNDDNDDDRIWCYRVEAKL